MQLPIQMTPPIQVLPIKSHNNILLDSTGKYFYLDEEGNYDGWSFHLDDEIGNEVI